MQPKNVLSVGEIARSDQAFWARPREEREGAFATLRAERPICLLSCFIHGIKRMRCEFTPGGGSPGDARSL